MSVDDLLNKIQQKIGFLNTSVDSLKEQQKALQKNSDKAKNCVHLSCDTELNHLKWQERNLLQQVEVVTENQKRLMDSQIARLSQLKGSLCATQKILHGCQFDDITALTCLYDGYVTDLKPMEDVNTPSVQNLLESALKSFKILYVSGDKKTQEGVSFTIPLRPEEYEHTEHDVLHKSLSVRSSGSEDAPIQVQIPKIITGGWLAKSSEKCGVPGETCRFREVPDKKPNENMSTWLSDLRVCEGSEGSRLGGSFELLDDDVATPRPGSIKSRWSSVSSSIEVVSSLDLEKELTIISGSDLESEKSTWLKIGPSDTSKPSPDSYMFMDVEEFACQANEPCSNYEECLCNGYCKQLASERAAQTSRWLLKSALESKSPLPVGEERCSSVGPRPAGVKRKLSPSDGGNEVLKHMRYILNSDQNKWLMYSDFPKAHKDLASSVQKSAILYKPRAECWLSDTVKNSESKVEENGSIVTYSPHSNVWLLHKLKEQRKKDHEERNKMANNEDNVQSFEEDRLGTGVSVTDLQGALAELNILLPKYSPTSTTVNTSNAYYTFGSPHAASVLNHNMSYLYRNNDFDLSRKLKWLSKPQSKSRLSGPGDLSNYLPSSLVALAEKNLDKWLVNRL